MSVSDKTCQFVIRTNGAEGKIGKSRGGDQLCPAPGSVKLENNVSFPSFFSSLCSMNTVRNVGIERSEQRKKNRQKGADCAGLMLPDVLTNGQELSGSGWDKESNDEERRRNMHGPVAGCTWPSESEALGCIGPFTFLVFLEGVGPSSAVTGPRLMNR